MKKISKLTRKGKILLRTAVAALIIVSISAGFTGAFLIKKSGILINNITPGSAQINITEPGVNPESVPWGADTKPVYVSVPADAVAGVVRVSLVPVLKDASGNVVSGTLGTFTEPVANEMILGDLTLHFSDTWSGNWFFKDGMFYYNKILNPGETSAQLLSGVTLTYDTPEKRTQYKDVKVEIEVMSDIIQTPGDAFSVWGVSVDPEGNVSPV
ncbi:MAG: hypothetical protein GX051_03935 [Clostridiales bacterium]|nr:hypothetical protein [Clostridiales bacterium]